MRQPAAAALAALALLAAPPARCAARPRPNVVLVVVDALRADSLGVYGSKRPTSPRIDALARHAVVFDDAAAASDWTLPALSSIMTGLYPCAHGALYPPTDDGWPKQVERGTFVPAKGGWLDPSRTTLAQAFSKAGYRTAGFINGGFPRAAFGFGRGFQLYQADGAPFGVQAQRLLAWVDESTGPFLAYVHVGDVHDPYAAPAPYGRMFDPDYRGPVDGSREWFESVDGSTVPLSAADLWHLRARYDGDVAYMDHALGRLVDGLKARGLYGSTILVLTADHGEAFGEHGYIRHGRSFYQELMRIPLIMRLPGGPEGKRVEVLAREVDLFPTLAAAAGLPPPRPVQGESLLPFLSGRRRGAPEETAAEKPSGSAYRRGPWKLMVGENLPPRLFDLSKDPLEKDDLAAKDPSELARMEKDWDGFRARCETLRRRLPPLSTPRPVLAPGLREKLRQSGYLPR